MLGVSPLLVGLGMDLLGQVSGVRDEMAKCTNAAKDCTGVIQAIDMLLEALGPTIREQVPALIRWTIVGYFNDLDSLALRMKNGDFLPCRAW